MGMEVPLRTVDADAEEGKDGGAGRRGLGGRVLSRGATGEGEGGGGGERREDGERSLSRQELRGHS
jgi:hypothetical protein